MAMKILSQTSVAAAATGVSTAVPANKEWVVSHVMVANKGATAGSFKMYACAAAAAAAVGNALAIDCPLNGNESVPMGQGITLAATDVLRYAATTCAVTFTIFGDERPVTP